MSKIKIVIDGMEVYADENKTIMEAAEESDIYIPHLCHHPDLHDVGGCRLCVVEIQGTDEAQTACTTKVEEGMIVKTKSEKLDKMRRLSMELMLANHVDDCTTCPKYLKCELQSLIQYLGVSTSRLRRTLNAVIVDTENPLIVRDLNRCVACGRCVRVCRDVRGVGILGFDKNEEERTYVGVKDNLSLENANCRFCGACVEVCPTGALQDKKGLFKEGNREEVLIPCKHECPAEINVPKYVRFIKEGNFEEAAAVIREKAPFPKSLGLVCMRFCESACRRKDINGAVSIRDLKRFAAESDSYKWKEKSFKKENTNRKIAVIGSGPAGLTAAYYLAKLGHAVDVHEKLPVAGGMLSAGIPDYRLPKEVVDSEIDIIRDAGVNIITGSKIESIKALKDKQYDVVLIAVGTDKGVRIPIPGSDLKDVYVNIDFLRRDLINMDIDMKKSVVVLGGGNVAFDCARSAKRLGCEKVSVVCLEAADNMTASSEELEEAKDEGIQIYNSRNFVKIEECEGNVSGIVCQEVEDFYFDENRKLILNIKENSEHLISGEMIIFATGQRADLTAFGEIELSQRGLVKVDEGYKTNVDGIFAVGDAVTGTASVIQAIAGARKAAASIDIYLGGDGVIEEKLSSEQPLNPEIGMEEGFAKRECSHYKCVSVDKRIDNFDLMTVGLDERTAKCEASRCLQCDLRPQLKKSKFWTEYKVK
ncbi:FAD-dependent oxidoreductase [Clostridium sp. PL3]|uniref:FAD-dependent oxidoreductase n=1 Tax=Clostridium thailandense TaxID=2794346 RepID=A0A949WTD8_9CLOT|nr:FAD-dependent oxidoreductase [Clostridium thailandense]MBV7276081.1 FAD-dependent oxidoreductase [Clostridium thailandense]